MATQRELAERAQRLWDQARNHLMQTLQPGNPRAFHQGINRSSLNHRSPYSNPNQGLSLAAGRMPNNAEITAFMQTLPEYKSLMRQMQKGGSAPKGGGQAVPEYNPAQLNKPAEMPVSDPMGLFRQLFAANQMALDRANAANEYRYAEGKGELSTLRDRNQERVGNWGYAAQADIDERMQEAVGNTRANLASRGMSNSSIGDAFAQRAARDTAREQQRVSEMRDSRMAEYDTNDTNNLVGFIERRNDVGPDYTGLMSQALQYSQAEAARQAQERQNAALLAAYRGNGGRGRSDVRLPPLPGPQGGVTPLFSSFTPVQMAGSMLAGAFNPMRQVGVTSNAYPTRRSPQEYAAIAQQQAQQQAQRALEADRNAWYSGRRSMLPAYQQPRTYA